MGTLISKIPQLLKARNLTPIDLVRRGLGSGTSVKVAKGATKMTLDTAVRLLEILEVSSLDELFEYHKSEDKQ